MRLPRASSGLAVLTASAMLLSYIAGSDATLRNGYKCDVSACKLPSCLCASDSPPLPIADTPMFVTLTFDDGMAEFLNADARKFLYATKNPNGCGISATHFLSRNWTDFLTVETMYKQGYEIADHTVDHVGNPSLQEIEAARTIYERWARVPRKDIVGFRAPFLAYSTDTFKNLQAAGGFQYDSSMSSPGNSPHWPYTMDYGLADECFTGNCPDLNVKFPGLWELPMYQLHNPADGSVFGLMDPAGEPDELLALFKYNFMNHWQTSKAPFGIYLHTAWILNDPTSRLSVLTQFFQWTQTAFPASSVWWVSNTQLLSWLKNPVPVSVLASSPPDYLSCSAAQVGPEMRLKTADMTTAYSPCAANRVQTCKYDDYTWKFCLADGDAPGCPVRQPTLNEPIPPIAASGSTGTGSTPSACSAPSVGCGFGKWNTSQCLCICLGSENATADASGRQGFCRDATGSCSLEKVVDPKVSRYMSCAESAQNRGDSGSSPNGATPAGTKSAGAPAAATGTANAAGPTAAAAPAPTGNPEFPLAPSTSRSAPAAAIAGAVVTVVALGIVGLIVYLNKRKANAAAKVGVEGKIELPEASSFDKIEVIKTSQIERTVSGLSPKDLSRRSSNVA